MKRKISIILVILISLSLLVACEKEDVGENISHLIEGRMDSLYTGEAGEEYMNLTGLTLDDISVAYEKNIRREALNFCNYTGILESGDENAYEALPEAVKEKLENMCRKVYAQASYEVRDPEEDSKGLYTIELVVTPVSVFREALSRIESNDYEPYAEFVKKYNTVDTGSDSFHEGLTDVLTQLVDETISSGVKSNPETYVLNISVTDDGYTISPEDWEEIDKSMIIY